MSHITLPPGKYYIGDPCYVFEDTTWDKLLGLDIDSGKVIEFNGQKLWVHSTAYGDGTYFDQNGTEYGVDAGLLGAVPIELIDNPSGEEDGTVIDAPNGLHVGYENGTFWFGAIVIKTDDQDEVMDGGYDGDPEDDEFI